MWVHRFIILHKNPQGSGFQGLFLSFFTQLGCCATFPLCMNEKLGG